MGQITFKGGTGTIQFKGGTGTIQFKNLGKVANPTVNAFYGRGNPGDIYLWQRVTVTNNDTETVTIYTGTSATPSTSRGPLAGGATTTLDIAHTSYQLGEEVSFTVYVQMKADGRLDSDIISDAYINPNQITNPTVEALWRYDAIENEWFKSVKVTNHYTQAVSVYAGLTSSNLELQSGTLAAGSSWTYNLDGPFTYNPTYKKHPFTAYVQLRAANKIDSEVISDYEEGDSF